MATANTAFSHIRSIEHFLRRADFSYVNSTLRQITGNAKIALADIDAILERHGWHLVVEIKHCINSRPAYIPAGQMILLRRLAEKPRTVVVVLHSSTGEIEDAVFAEVVFNDATGIFSVPCRALNEGELISILKWFEAMARQNPAPRQQPVQLDTAPWRPPAMAAATAVVASMEEATTWA
jgi:hypothetical protein